MADTASESESLKQQLLAHPVVDMPDDFIPVLKTLKATEDDADPILSRLQHPSSIDRRAARERGSALNCTQEQFAARLDSL